MQEEVLKLVTEAFPNGLVMDTRTHGRIAVSPHVGDILMINFRDKQITIILASVNHEYNDVKIKNIYSGAFPVIDTDKAFFVKLLQNYFRIG